MLVLLVSLGVCILCLHQAVGNCQPAEGAQYIIISKFAYYSWHKQDYKLKINSRMHFKTKSLVLRFILTFLTCWRKEHWNIDLGTLKYWFALLLEAQNNCQIILFATPTTRDKHNKQTKSRKWSTGKLPNNVLHATDHSDTNSRLISPLD